MSDHQPQSNDHEERAAKLTAYALGELDAAERSRVEADLAADADARRVYAEVQGVAEALTGGRTAIESKRR